MTTNNSVITDFSSTNRQLKNYQILECLYTGSKSIVYRAKRISDQQLVILKLLRNEHPSFNELIQFQNQYTIIQGLDLAGIIQPIALEPYHNSLLLVMLDDGSISLSRYLETQSLEAKDRLELGLNVGLQLAKTLADLHQHRIIHKDIKPQNILIHPQTLAIKVIDFSIASQLPQETKEIQNPSTLEGTLAYIAPEQTGRMNRGIDYRSDFYSLGITLYELFTGQLPFQSDDPLELVYAHLAQKPVPISELNPEVPTVVAAMVTKLMAKNAEDRYQSAVGLKADFSDCLNQWKATGTIQKFVPGELDEMAQFNIPQKLYGRETQVNALMQVFERISQGSFELVLIGGYSGVGKTALVNEMLRQLTRTRGYFSAGKFDQFRRLPMDAPIQGCRGFIREILTESQERLNYWRDRFLKVLGANAQLIIDAIPELELIIGEQPPVPEVGAIEAAQRLGQTFNQFNQTFSSAEHPYICFMDDLQWADSASLQSLQSFLSDSNSHHFLIVTAYRDNEVSPTHPFIQTVESLRQSGVKITEITLEPLQLIHVAQLVADTLHTTVESVMSLAKLLFEKTNGNPFFLTQLLKSLYEEELIWFDMEARKWRWALGRIQQEGVTDNVVELMISRIGQLPETTQRALQVAANIGNQFDLKTLAVAAERSVQGIGQNLWPAIREGLIIPTTEAYKAYQTAVEIQHSIPDARECTYRFLHDRVQQAAYELIPEEQKQITHYRIGQLLFKNSSEIERYERIFEIVNHLNHGATLVNAQAERNQLAQLNLIAGQKAKAIAAYSTACNYFVAGLRIAEENSWQTQYELTLSLHYGWTEVLYLLGEFEQMRSASSIVIQNSSNLIDKIPVYLTQISAYQGQGEGLKALELGLQVLELLGIKLPDKPAKQDISQAMEKTILLFENKNREELIYADETHNPKVIASQKILSIMMGCTYLEAPMFLPLIICEQARLSICFGKTDLAAQIYGNYGMLLCSSVSSIESGNKAGEIALELFKESTEQNSKACVYNLIYSYIRPWKYSLRASLEPLKNSFNSGLGTGETEYASYAICHYCMFLFLSGETLDQVEKEISIYKKAVKEVHQVTMYNLLGVIYQSIIPLMNANDSPTRMNEKVDHKLDVDISQELELKDGISFCILYINKLVLSYLSGEIESAIHFSQEANQYLDYIPAEIYNSTFHFYRALTYLADDTVPSPDGDCFTTELIESFNKTKYFAIHAPMNHQHKVDLVEAEKCRVLGQKAEAIERYDKAIAGAKENEYIQEEALANELAAKFYLEWGKEKIAQAYLIEAYYCYGRWGTAAKTTQLEQQYPELLSPILQQKRVGLDSFQTQTTTGRIHQNTSQYVASSSSISHLLDLTSVMKASQVLSGEIELEKLLTKLMRVILENAGATKGVLLMNRDQTLSVEVIATQSSEWGISINQQTLLTIESLDIPLKLINLVKRQLEPIIVDDVLNHAECASDPYLIQQQPKSLLCLPILSHGELLAILYLENQLITQAFTNERVEILKLLCSQAAISLENAELYQKSQNYAHQLEQSLTQLQEAQVQLVQSEKMSALGQMMSGITHEINNPLGFVAGNIGQVEEALQDVFEYLELYQKYHPPGEEVTAYAEEIELEYVLEDLPEMVTSMKTGINRIKEISKSMRIFSRADQEKTVGFNLHEGLDSTLLILRHRLKATEKRPEIQVIKEYGDLPQVNGFPGQLNQVFMNILANAADVFDEMSTERSIDEMKPHSYQITLKTKLDSDNQMVVVRIQDNGGGMPEETKAKIFEHLFTTKAVGKGTGLGLSIARQIVVDKHHGKLECYSTLGQGTEFIIQLPT